MHLVLPLLTLLAAAAPAKPSPGCGKPKPPTGELTLESQGGRQAYILSLPPGYDPAHPYPLAFAFHGRDRTHVDCRDEDCPGVQSVIAPKAVVVYPKSIGPGWQPAVAENTAFFADLLARVERDVCVDQRRIFVAGTSSGAIFSNHLGCKLGDRLLAIAPVHGALLERDGCKGTPAVINIHGIADKLIPRAAGESARDFFAARDGCGPPAQALAPLTARILAARKAGRTEVACVDYQRCTGAPVRWCVHSEPGYEDLNHGWPTDGGKLIWEFVSALP
jgi:polyhydroxybutyrate depolymerase